MPAPNDHILTLSCPDKPGIIHAVTGIFASHGHNVLDLQQFSDPVSRRFFMRVHFGPNNTPDASTKHLDAPFSQLATEYDMTYDFRPMAQKMKVLIMVSKIGHCLNDLLFRVKTGQLNVEVTQHAPFFSSQLFYTAFLPSPKNAMTEKKEAISPIVVTAYSYRLCINIICRSPS